MMSKIEVDIFLITLTNNAHVGIRKSRPNLNAAILCQLFLSALVGATLTQYFFFLGIEYTSASLSCAFMNIIPILTFVMALPFRATSNSTFHVNVSDSHEKTHRWIIGSIALFAELLIWFVSYGLFRCRVFLRGDVMVCKKKGPLFTTTFSPFIQIIVVMYEVTILHEQLYLGRYISLSHIRNAHRSHWPLPSLWGKSKEAKACEAKPVEATNEEGDQDQRYNASS
ncbi:hypothetical protein IFM89_037872 [Coptis chinensis]|uniref:WAT1-related protein n=1 Tax=Coptis chinensis TaxID=261450 RepID=A0A835HRY7_9MAGN|nr:hypothetical protein IFM89_037872 [Coptis chinensis]